MIRQISFENTVLALIFTPETDFAEGTQFVTDDKNLLQLGYMKYKENKLIEPHIHKPFRRETYGTNEVLYIKEGRIKADFYSSSRKFVKSLEINKGSWLILLEGGHGFETLEPTIMVEIKNGPYANQEDKVRF